MNKREKESMIYREKYSNIPLDLTERIEYMVDMYNLSQNKMNEIMTARNNMIDNMFYTDYKILILYEEPKGAKRPRYTVSRNNFNTIAKSSDFVRVYSPDAQSDKVFMKRLIGSELDNINQMIYTPCEVRYDAYLPTPTSFSINQKFLAEIGLIRPISKPDWDNIGKKYSDMYNSTIWFDDRLVVDGSVHKFYSILPRVEIYLKYLNCLYNKQQYDSINNINTPYINGKGEIINV